MKKNREKKTLKPISLSPLTPEQAIDGILQFNPNSVKQDEKAKESKQIKKQT